MKIAADLTRPVPLKGEAGVGKTEVAKVRVRAMECGDIQHPMLQKSPRCYGFVRFNRHFAKLVNGSSTGQEALILGERLYSSIKASYVKVSPFNRRYHR